MRLSYRCVLSTAHMPAAEHGLPFLQRGAHGRVAFGALIEASPCRAGRIVVGHEVLSIEPHQFGFAVHLGLFDDHAQRPPQISEALWNLLILARNTGADWLSFDRDEEVAFGMPSFADEPAHQMELRKATSEDSTTIPRFLRCPGCGSSDVICDASARWDGSTESCVLVEVFDAAFCEGCETDVVKNMAPSRPVAADHADA